MNEINIVIDGKKKKVPFLSEYKDVLNCGNSCYEDNPIVGVLVNGKLSSLSERIDGDSEIESIHLFSPLGKRIYRKSLCLLLSYASSLVYPKRQLVIGHYSSRYEDESLLLEQAREVFPNTIAATENLTIKIR